ncbi:DUF362 domain-containing protein [Hymenobacter sp. BT18]|uniref:DUF362 domain-containing protein n=1 Tax=Hymenobacter sp. BT18 TaxID=2835648 RepID=UPI00143E9193|nr:DUF362 domain-containing protein [Hymenobacter sp. BT18]QIX59924.1 DUF362 domain-containing protein [Hymenobacter sp. BT18]
MRRFLFLLLLSSLASLPDALAQQPPVTATTPPMYGLALIELSRQVGGSCSVILSDGVTPNPKAKVYQENGRNREFADEAAALNFLYNLGWEVIPNGSPASSLYINRYLLKRRNQ